MTKSTITRNAVFAAALALVSLSAPAYASDSLALQAKSDVSALLAKSDKAGIPSDIKAIVESALRQDAASVPSIVAAALSALPTGDKADVKLAVDTVAAALSAIKSEELQLAVVAAAQAAAPYAATQIMALVGQGENTFKKDDGTQFIGSIPENALQMTYNLLGIHGTNPGGGADTFLSGEEEATGTK